MAIKETLLAMPAWKAGTCVALCLLAFSVVVHEVFAHTVFQVMDHVLDRMEKEKLADIADLDSFETHKGIAR